MRSELERLADVVHAVLQDSVPFESAANRLAGADRCVVLGRGFGLAAAFEWALKLQELCYLAALPFSAADFEHGPLALAEPGFPVLAVTMRGPLNHDVRALLTWLRDEAGVELFVASDDPAALALGQGLSLPRGTPEWAGPVTAAVVTQLFCHDLAVARGIDPDAPRALRKVTRTR